MVISSIACSSHLHSFTFTSLVDQPYCVHAASEARCLCEYWDMNAYSPRLVFLWQQNEGTFRQARRLSMAINNSNLMGVDGNTWGQQRHNSHVRFPQLLDQCSAPIPPSIRLGKLPEHHCLSSCSTPATEQFLTNQPSMRFLSNQHTSFQICTHSSSGAVS